MEYIRHILSGLRSNIDGVCVTLLTSGNAAEHPNCMRLIEDFHDLVTVRIAPSVSERSRLFGAISSFYEYQWRNANTFERGYAEIGPKNVDFVLLPYLENIGLLHLGLRPHLFKEKPWGTIGISVRYHHRKYGIPGPTEPTDFLQGIFHRRVLRNHTLAFFGTINPYLVPATNHPKVIHCPDPGERPVFVDPEAARLAYGIRPETIVVVVFGIIDQRKCIDILLQGAALLVHELDLTVFLAGPQNQDHVAQALSSGAARRLREHGRLKEVDRFLLSGRDVDPLAAADISWVMYERKFVAGSSVMIRSALYHRPVIARRQGVMGRQVEEYKCGLTLSSEAPEDVAAALVQLARDPGLRQTMGENGARAFARNTPENFAQPIVDGINQALAVDESANSA
jgi:glycosyltransferase involved in cell wall biosynthesis